MNTQDIEELVRCSRERATSLVDLVISNQELAKTEIKNFAELRKELLHLAQRIGSAPGIAKMSRLSSRKHLD